MEQPNEKGIGQATVLSFGEERYVIAESLLKALGKKWKNPDVWIHEQIKKQRLVIKKDYFDFGEGVLFSFEVAVKIFAQCHKPKKAYSEDRPKVSKHGFPLDEYGLAIVPPAKNQRFINPYSLDSKDNFLYAPPRKRPLINPFSIQ